jgi:hypothetical protein
LQFEQLNLHHQGLLMLQQPNVSMSLYLSY